MTGVFEIASNRQKINSAGIQILPFPHMAGHTCCQQQQQVEAELQQQQFELTTPTTVIAMCKRP